MDAARKASLMRYCRIDELADGEEQLLEGMYQDAVGYLTGAGIAVPDSGTARGAQFDQMVNALVLDSWDNRGSQTAGYSLMENPAFRRRMTQLKLTQPVLDAEA